jgi:23S rRNA (uracil1939-C5)-methyltransferase
LSAAVEPDRLALEVGILDARGAALTELDGRAIAVDGALPGERVLVERPRRRQRRIPASTVEVLEPSPARVAARCAHFGVCGGCALQHLAHEAQLELKQRLLLAALEAHDVVPARVRPPIAGHPWSYRRKARLGAKLVPRKGGVLLGFRERHAPYVAVLEACEILVQPVGRRIRALRELLGSLRASATIPQIEVAAGDDRAALVVRHLEPLAPEDRAALAAFARDTSLEIHLQPGGPATVAALEPEAPALLRYGLPAFELELEFGPMDFVQVNAAVNRSLVSAAVDALDLRGGERVLDLFCGIGNFTLPMACRAGHVLGIESSPELVARARANAQLNARGNASFEAADLYADALPEALGRAWDRLVLDPPRSGALEVVRALGAGGPPRIVYVSCNPETLARDASELESAGGYRLTEAGIVDMFPHTMHLESIAVFER